MNIIISEGQYRQVKDRVDIRSGMNFILIESEKAKLVSSDSEDFLSNLESIDKDISQSDSKTMSFKKNVETFQIALELLGYRLPIHGVDGLFGPETGKSLNRFKSDNEIEFGDGKSVFDGETKDVMVSKIKDIDIDDDDIKKYTLPSKVFTTTDGDITHRYGGEAAQNIQKLIDVMVDEGITDPTAQVGMLAVIGKETHFINKKEKGYQNTSNNRIRSLFSRTRNMLDSQLNNLKKDYDEFFNFVYNGRIGNNNINDGSKYVGRGFNQLTGKGNYEKYSQVTGMDLVSNPDIMLDDDVAAEVAVKFLTKKGVPNFEDPNESTIYFADINSGSPKRRSRENSMRELQKFDIV